MSIGEQIEKLEDEVHTLKTRHMLRDMDGDTTHEDVIAYRNKFKELRDEIDALKSITHVE